MIRSFLPAALAITGLISLTSEAQAQHVHFSFGGHGHGHGHHYHHSPYWCRPGWDFGYYYAPPPRVTYVQPERTIIVPQTTVVAPAVSSLQAPVSNVATVPSTSNVAATAPPVRTNSLPANRGPGISIQNRNAAGLAVACVVDGQTQLELRPGETRPMREKAVYVVEFDRGASFGTAKYELTEGEYEFVVTDRGWDLQRDATGGTWQTATLPPVKKNSLPTTMR
jgi:hypothetical protein